MNIIFFEVPKRPTDGGGVYTARVHQYLCRHEQVVTVHSESLPSFRRLGPIACFLWLRREYARVARGLGPHVVVVGSNPGRFGLFNWYLKTRRAVRTVAIVHHLDLLLEHRWAHRVRERLLHWGALCPVDRVVAISRNTRGSLESMLRLPSARIRVVRPGVDLVRAPARDDDPTTFEALFVGSCTPRKGVEFLLQALALLPDGLDYRLHLVGECERDRACRERLEATIRRHQLGERVVFHGKVGDAALAERYRQADVLVLPSLWEGYGMVLAEAQMYGLPVIASRVGAIPEVVEDGADGLLVPPADPPALARALARLAADSGLRRALGEQGRTRALAAPRWEDVGQSFHAVLMRLEAEISPNQPVESRSGAKG